MQFTARELEKDLGRGDITTASLFKEPKNVTARIVAKESGVLAGRQEIEFFLNTSAKRLRVKFLKRDGCRIKAGYTFAILKGDIREILKVERVILNLLGRMSGVATTAARIVAKAKKINPKILITPTRKTLWGLLDKRACVLGGAGTHRLNLGNAILIKDNHLDAFGRNIPKAIESFFPTGRASARLSQYRARRAQPIRQKATFFEIEVETSREAKIACTTLKKLQKAGKCTVPCFVMLDNFSPQKIKKTLKILRTENLASCAKIEASGGINEKNISAYAKTGVDVISMGALTHSAPMLDVSLVTSDFKTRH